VLRSVPDGILVVEGGCVQYANGPAAALWGMSPGAIAGLPLYALEGRGPAPVWFPDSEMEVNDRTYQVSVTPVIVGGGRVVVFHDVTAARQLERLREDLANMLVHDLRSPLSSIQTTAAMILKEEGVRPGSSVAQEVCIVHSSATRILEMVENLLDVARIEAGRMPVEAQAVEIAPLVAEAIEQVIADAKVKEVEVRNDVPAILLAQADAGLLARVVVNLVGNAIKFAPSRTPVVLTARVDESDVVLSVSDQGKGIAPEDLGCIFDRFTQAGQKRQRGSGLGLTFCKLAVEAQAGRIWVESEVGKGSTFYVALPAAPARVDAGAGVGAGETASDVSGRDA
jgi:signal transduction histidine kinase